MKKKIFALFTLLTLVFTLIPNNISFASENDYFYGVWETDSKFFQLTDATDWTFKKVSDSLASGGYTMQSFKVSGDFDGDKRLYTDSLEVPKDGKYKLFVRIKGADSIQYSVNGKSYIAPHMMYSETEYKWLYMKEIELFSAATLKEKGLGDANTVSFAPNKHNTYFDKVAITNDPLCYPVGTADNFSGGGFSSVYPKPDVYPQKNSHPRVFINKNNLDDIKNNLTHNENIDVYNKVKEYASKNYTGKLTQGVNYNNYNYEALECAKANAFLYLMDKDEEKAKKAIDIMTNYMSTLKYAESGSLMEIRGTGTAIVAASMVYDWCYNAFCFTKEKKEKLASLCITQANNLECGWPPVRLNSLTEGHSHENSVMKDMFAFAIAVYDEYPEIYDLVGGRMFAEYIPYLNNRYKDGATMHSQGDNYGVGRFRYELYPALLLRGMGYDNVIDDNQLYMAYQQIIRTRPDGATFNDGDIFDHAVKDGNYKVTTADPSVAFYASVLFEDLYMKGYFKELMPYPENMNLGDDFSPVLYLALNNTLLGSKSKNNLPLTVYGGDVTGMLTARTSWEDGKNSNAMLVSMKLPENWRNNHQHLDAGNFEIYYKGPLAIDSGLYTDAGNSHDLNYNKRTIAHNTILVRKEGEKEYSGVSSIDGGQRAIYSFPYNMTMDDVTSDKSKAGEVMFLDWGKDLLNPSYTYFKGDMTNWYSDKVSLFERSFMFLNFFDEVYPGALIVFDKVESGDKDYKKTWLLHSQQEPVINGNVTTIVRDENGYNGKLINETLLPYENKITKVGGDGYEYYYDGVNYPAYPNDNAYSDESGNWRIELSPKNSDKKDYFLNVLTVCENDNTIIPLDAELTESELFYQVEIKDRVCYFAKDSRLIGKAFVVENNNAGETEYCITGLEKGMWKITSGTDSFEREVTEKGSVLNFKITQGIYEIKKIDNSEISESKSELDILVERSVVSGKNVQNVTVSAKFNDFTDGEYALLKIFDKGLNENILSVNDFKYIGQAKINPDGSFKHTFKFNEQGNFTFTLTSHKEKLETSEYYISDIASIEQLITDLNNGKTASYAKEKVDIYNKELMFDTKVYKSFSDETKLLIWNNMISEIGTNFNINNIYDSFNKHIVIDGINQAQSQDVVKNIIEYYNDAYLNLENLSVNNIKVNMSSTELNTVYNLMRGNNFTDFDGIRAKFVEAVILSKYKNTSNYQNIEDLLLECKNELYIQNEITLYEKLSTQQKKAVCLYLSDESGKVNSISDTENGLKGKFKYALNNILLLINLYSTPPTVSVGGGGGGGGTSQNVEISNDYVEKNDTEDVVYSSSLSDLNEVSWASKAINSLYAQGIINGKYPGKYMPYDNVTRAEMTKLISVALNIYDENAESSFNDAKGHWGYRYISSAANKGYILGIAANEFGADNEITRQDVAVILYRVIQYMAKTKRVENLTVSYTDMDEISEYARNSVIMLSEYNILNGFEDGSFKPKDSLNRAQAAVVIYKLLDFINN